MGQKPNEMEPPTPETDLIKACINFAGDTWWNTLIREDTWNFYLPYPNRGRIVKSRDTKTREELGERSNYLRTVHKIQGSILALKDGWSLIQDRGEVLGSEITIDLLREWVDEITGEISHFFSPGGDAKFAHSIKRRPLRRNRITDIDLSESNLQEQWEDIVTLFEESASGVSI